MKITKKQLQEAVEVAVDEELLESKTSVSFNRLKRQYLEELKEVYDSVVYWARRINYPPSTDTEEFLEKALTAAYELGLKEGAKRTR